MTKEMIEIVEDKYALELGLRILMVAAERKALPEEVFLPTFNDSMLEETYKVALEKVSGQKFS
jgi:hypothetical protein